MPFVSTGGIAPTVSLGEALRRGLAPDGGLYLPESLPPLPRSFFEELPGLDLREIAYRVLSHLLTGELPPGSLREIVDDALDFPIPLRPLGGDSEAQKIRVLELFHGPTLAFKDVGARFLARLLAATRATEGETLVLVATSGDTGGAVAQAFFGVSGVRVAVLYPKGQVSPLQERQFATLGGNVRALAVKGTFDDCQALVKRAFADSHLAERLGLTSANSINVGRLLPQSVYYFEAAARLFEQEGGRPPILFSTPSGNFGNLTAGLIARRLGLEAHFLAATNRNDVVPEYLESGLLQPRPSLRTPSNAMDVGNPSNIARIQHLYGGSLEKLREHVWGHAVDDESTRRTIAEVASRTGYVMDPHTAVGYLALREHLHRAAPGTVGIVLSTAHPAKFLEVVEPVLGRTLEIPPALASRRELPLLARVLENEYPALRDVLLEDAP
jgi:threonine synthase